MKKQRIALWVLFCCGVVGHAGTAVLRLGSFFPYPRSVDFSAFYAAAHALRQGLSPYGLGAGWLLALQNRWGIPFRPPAIYNPAIWPWLLQPVTYVSFPVAAWSWLLLNLGLLVWCGLRLARLAELKKTAEKAGVLFLVLTFGPVVLDLSLGQTSCVLLGAALAVGQVLAEARVTRVVGFRSMVAYGVAVGAKLVPLTWLGALVVLRRWRSLWFGALAALVVLAASVLVTPESTTSYWTTSLPQRLFAASDSVELDDQSLVAWMQRIALPQTYAVQGLSTDDLVTVTWAPTWNLSRMFVLIVGYGTVGFLGIMAAIFLIRVPEHYAEAGLYLWVLYTLLAFPHIARYNHVLVLPAMAWLWGRRRNLLVVIAYGLLAMSRLTHLWVRVVPAPWGPLLTGAGPVAVLLVGIAMADELRHLGRAGMGELSL